jgi:L-threonylcarbamoyladenylate synthase
MKRQDLHEAVAILKAGGVVVFPTDTAYGLAVDATNPAAIKKLQILKGRDFNKPIHIIPPSKSSIGLFARISAYEQKLIDKFLPGALTLVLQLKSSNPTLDLIKGPTGIGIRYPKNNTALDLARRLGRPITATSANLAGGPNTYSVAQVKKQFVQSRHKPDFYLDGGRLKPIKPSTIVAIENNNVKILREGPISIRKIKKVLNKP